MHGFDSAEVPLLNRIVIDSCVRPKPAAGVEQISICLKQLTFGGFDVFYIILFLCFSRAKAAII